MAGGAPIDVSCIIAGWNAEAFIQRAIRSALDATGVSVEVIVVDDASSDATFDVARGMADMDKRIIVERLPVNAGPSAARNRAIELSSGRYIAVLDADDALLPQRLGEMVEVADTTGADIILDNMKEVDLQGRPLHERDFLSSAQFKARCDIDLSTWIRFNQPLGHTECLGYLKPVIRRAVLESTGVRYDVSLRNSEDYYLIARLLASGARMTYVPDAGYLYTRSAGSTSHRLSPANTRAILDGEKRFQLEHRQAFSASEMKALARRERLLRNLNQLVQVIDAASQRRLLTCARLIVSDPAGAAFVFDKLARIAAGKLLRRKLV